MDRCTCRRLAGYMHIAKVTRIDALDSVYKHPVVTEAIYRKTHASLAEVSWIQSNDMGSVMGSYLKLTNASDTLPVVRGEVVQHIVMSKCRSIHILKLSNHR
jgi:hypothetical protein